MNTVRIHLLPVLALSLLWATPSFASSAHFGISVDNDSGETIKVDILHTDGTIAKSYEVTSGPVYAFEFSVQCHNEHHRQFAIYNIGTDDMGNEKIGSKLAEGDFTMTAGKKKDFPNDAYCHIDSFVMDSCDDLKSGDHYNVSCKKLANYSWYIIIN